MPSSRSAEFNDNYSQFNCKTIPPPDERDYGSMLQSPSVVIEIGPSFDNTNYVSELNNKFTNITVEDVNENMHATQSDLMRWEVNYNEAAIFLEEGKNNEKFESHPRCSEDLKAYLVVHNRLYNAVDFCVSLILLFLAFIEAPVLPMLQVPVWVHGTIELTALTTVCVQVYLKLRWIGWRYLIKHRRTTLKCITLIIMFVEAITVLIRQSSHFRVTRTLRPIFLLDTRYCGGVRRFIRQIFLTLPPILDMLGLLLFFVMVYTVVGYFMFSEMNKNFLTLEDSFVSLFVLLTTANFPDVMMPSYSQNKWYALYFVFYLCTMLYVIMNLVLAVVNETFTSYGRNKFKKLYLHKRKACQHAFKLLASHREPNEMTFRHFEGLMRYYAPHKSKRDVVLMFSYMNASKTGTLNCEEFLSIYDAINLQWERINLQLPWYHIAWRPVHMLHMKMYINSKWSFFEVLMHTLALCNCIAMVIRITGRYNKMTDAVHRFAADWDSFLFGTLFLLEALWKMVNLGVKRYVSSGWNIFELMVSAMTCIAAFILTFYRSATFLVLFRPFNSLRLFKLKKRYRDVFGTLAILFPQMCSTAIVMLILYYFFAIIGMEVFAGYDLRNCCKNTSVEDFFKYSVNGSTVLGYYYLNTFDNLVVSSITLFELTVVNNWFVLMNGYAFTAGTYTRIYFMTFYLVTMIVLTIVVSNFLEAFQFRIQYKKLTSKVDGTYINPKQIDLQKKHFNCSNLPDMSPEEKLLHVEVEIKRNELQYVIGEFLQLPELQLAFTNSEITKFKGSRSRTRDVLQRKMYACEIEKWVAEAKLEEIQFTLFNIENESNDCVCDTDRLVLNDNLQ